MLTICTYKQARAHRPKGRENTRENKAKWEARSCRRNSTEMCLGSSDDSQSSCLLASRFPSLDAAPTVSVSRPLCFRLPLLAHSLFLSLSLSLVSVLFCSSRTHRCGTSIVLKSFHLLAPLPPAVYSLRSVANGRDTGSFREFSPSTATRVTNGIVGNR